MTDRMHTEHDRPQPSLGRSVIEGVSWPVPETALAALVDMGLSDDRIGRYFHVDAAEVRCQRERARRPSAAPAGRHGLGGASPGGDASGR